MKAPRILAAAVVGLILTNGATSVQAASPTLGATLRTQGSPVIEDLPQPVQIEVVNRSTIPVDARLTITGDGYSLATADLGLLQPAASGFTTLSTIGAGTATVTAQLVQPDPGDLSGKDAVALRLSLDLRHRNTLEQIAATMRGVPWWLWLALIATLLIIVLSAVDLLRGRRRPGAPPRRL